MQGEKDGVRDREEDPDVKVGTKGQIWPYEPGRHPRVYKVYTDDLNIAAKIAGWKGCRYHATYYHPDGRVVRDVLVPAALYKRACELLGVPARAKNPNRVRAGKKAGAAALARGQLKNTATDIPSSLVGGGCQIEY